MDSEYSKINKDYLYNPTKDEILELKQKHPLKNFVPFDTLAPQDQIKLLKDKEDAVVFKMENNQFSKKLTLKEHMSQFKYQVINKDTVIVF